MNNEKFNQLIWFLEESLRLKIYLVNFLYYIRETYDTIKNLNVYKESSFVKFANSNSNLFYNQLLKYRDFEKELNDFLLKNAEIDNFLNQNNLNFVIIKTHFDYYEEVFSSLEEKSIDERFFGRGLNEYIELLEAEIIEVDKFKSICQDKIEELKRCYICKTEIKDSLALYICKICRKPICKNHMFRADICIHCSEKIIDDYQQNL